MTVSYSRLVANGSSFGCFWSILFKIGQERYSSSGGRGEGGSRKMPLSEVICCCKKTALKKILSKNKIVLFTQKRCHHCHDIQKILEMGRIEYTEVVVDIGDNTSPLTQQLISTSGYTTIPQLYIDGEFIAASHNLLILALSGEMLQLCRGLLNKSDIQAACEGPPPPEEESVVAFTPSPSPPPRTPSPSPPPPPPVLEPTVSNITHYMIASRPKREPEEPTQ